MIIVASGPSATGFVPPPDIPVICVNGVIGWIDRADYWFTLDCTTKNLARCRSPRPGVQYFAAVPERYTLPDHVTRLSRISGNNAPGLSDIPGTINSGNSAFGALGLAYHLGAKKVILIGVDGNRKPRVEGGHSGSLTHLPKLFNSAANQIQIVNCGDMNAISIAKMSISEGIKWLRK